MKLLCAPGESILCDQPIRKPLTIHTLALTGTCFSSHSWSSCLCEAARHRRGINIKCAISFWHQAVIKYFALSIPAGCFQPQINFTSKLDIFPGSYFNGSGLLQPGNHVYCLSANVQNTNDVPCSLGCQSKCLFTPWDTSWSNHLVHFNFATYTGSERG